MAALRTCGIVIGFAALLGAPAFAQPKTDAKQIAATCELYARTAVDQINRMTRVTDPQWVRSCRAQGPRWLADHNAHFGWCMSVIGTTNDRSIAVEQAARADHLTNNCNLRTAGPPPVRGNAPLAANGNGLAPPPGQAPIVTPIPNATTSAPQPGALPRPGIRSTRVVPDGGAITPGAVANARVAIAPGTIVARVGVESIESGDTLLYTALSGRHLYVSTADGRTPRLLVFDISVRSRPTLVHTVPLPGVVTARIVFSQTGDYAYLMTGGGSPTSVSSPGTLQVVDNRSPARAVIVGQVAVPVTSASDVTLLPGGRVIVAGGSALFTVDVSRPTNPVLLGRTAAGQSDNGFIAAVSSSIVYWSDGERKFGSGGRLIAIDVSNPSRSTIVAEMPTGTQPSDIRSSDGFVYITFENSAIEIWDARNPRSPRLVSRLSADCGNPKIMGASGGYVYLYDYSSNQSYQVIDVHNPAEPEVAPPVDMKDVSAGIGLGSAADGYGYAAVGSQLRIIRLQ